MKVLGDGDLSVKLTLDVDRVSASARAKIEAAGGSATERIARKVKATPEFAAPRAAADDEEETSSSPAEDEASSEE